MLKFLGVGFCVYLILCIFGSIAIMTIPRLPVTANPQEISINYEPASFPSRNGTALKGWFFPGSSLKALIIVNGGYQNRVDDVSNTSRIAHDLVANGLNVLLFDLSGRGESSGKGVTLKYEPNDIGGAVDYLKQRGFSTGSIGLMGFCSGAASVCIFSAGETVGAVVLDGCFAHIKTMVENQALERHIPIALLDVFYSTMQVIVKNTYGFSVQDPIESIARINSPILLIHEEYDDLTSYQDTVSLFLKSQKPTTSIWEISGASHSQAYDKYPQEYIARLTSFFLG